MVMQIKRKCCWCCMAFLFVFYILRGFPFPIHGETVSQNDFICAAYKSAGVKFLDANFRKKGTRNGLDGAF